jgi:hypothetical protein
MANEFYVRKGLIVSGSTTLSGSAVVREGLTVSSSANITGSLTVTTGITGSLFGTASVATTASYAANADLLDGLNSTVFATTGSNTFVGNQTISGSTTVRDNLTVNTNTLFADATNNRVGVGTISPTTTLQVQGNVSASSFTGSLSGNASTVTNGVYTTGDQTIGGVKTFTSDISIADAIVHTGDTDTSIRFIANNTITFNTDFSERVRIDDDGRIGINTTSPGARLDVVGNNAQTLLHVRSPSATAALFVSGSGNVGIGTTTPATTLQVNGNVSASSFTGSLSGNATSATSATTATNATNINTENRTTNESGYLVFIGTTATGNVKPYTNTNIRINPSTGMISASTFNATSATDGGFQGIAADTVTTPSFTWTDSLTTGMYHPTSTSIGFTVSGTERVRVTTTGANVTGSLDVTGAFTAQTKSFKIPHQTQVGKSLVYGVLEGREHSVYARGKLNGNDTIELPDEWTWLVDEDSITVQLTPIGSHQKLYVQSIYGNKIVVKNDNLFSTTIHCYYIVHATRKDVDPLITVV